MSSHALQCEHSAFTFTGSKMRSRPQLPAGIKCPASLPSTVIGRPQLMHVPYFSTSRFLTYSETKNHITPFSGGFLYLSWLHWNFFGRFHRRRKAAFVSFFFFIFFSKSITLTCVTSTTQHLQVINPVVPTF